MSNLLLSAGRSYSFLRWIGIVLLASSFSLPAIAQPTVNGLYWGDGDDTEYSAVAVSPAGRGILYAAIGGGTVYALIRVDTTANENVFGDCKGGSGLDCAYMLAQKWGVTNGKSHTFKRLWDSEFSTWEVSCTDNQNDATTHTWTWTQNYMSIKSGSSCSRDTDPDLCSGDYESVATGGTPPPGTVMSTSLVYNMNNHVAGLWDATVGGTRTDATEFRSDLGLDGYPAYSATLDYEWNMNYEISFPIPGECDPTTLKRGIIAAHHSPEKDNGGDIVIPPPDTLYDLGDNPDSYGTLLASSGPRHMIKLTSVLLGSIIDAEGDGAPSISSDGDDNLTSDDEDGVTFSGLVRNECIPGPGTGVSLDIAYTSDSSNVLLDAWIDLNLDGDYDDPGEKFLEIDLDATDAADAGGADGVAELPLVSCAPTIDVFDGDSTYVRFRVHLGDTPLGPQGDADNGEVEDYLLYFTGGTTRILPVELMEFGAVVDGSDVVLSWATASETNNAGFSIEQSSVSDGEFRPVAFVEGAGTTVDEQAYTHRVMDVEPGTLRFRLKQVDFDGAFEYSPVVEVTSEVPGGFVLEPAYPNPFNPTTNIRFAIERSDAVTMELYDVSGRVVRTLYDGVPTANQMITVTIDAGGLASGIYLVRLAGADFMTSQIITVLK